jgi:hypothetical protein
VQSATALAASASIHAVAPDTGARPQSTSTGTAASGIAAGSDRSAQMPDNLSAAAEPASAAAAAVNTARLIQRAGDAEIRVGMRSSDFGNVSISTVTTRNSISAQIAVDHGELAKAIAAHLPEVQARLGENQPLEMRVSTSHQAAGLMGDAQGGMRQDTAGRDSGSGRQFAPSYSSRVEVREPEPVGVLAMAASTSQTNQIYSRLDVMV